MQRSEVTRYWMGRGFDWILANPGKWVVLELKKLWRFAGSYEYSTEYIIYVEREAVRSLWLAPLPFAVIVVLAGVGLLAQRRKGLNDATLLLVLFVAANLAVVLMFYVSSRYRMPSAPYLILFAASGLAGILEALRSPLGSDRTGAWVTLAAAALVAVPLHVIKDDSHKIQEANAHYNMGNAHYNKSQFAEAIREYDRAVAGDRSNWRAWFNRGNALRSLGRNPEAIESYREVLRRNKEMTAARRLIQELGGTP
jgi:tetratricopeptide (TPR) repeat protein